MNHPRGAGRGAIVLVCAMAASVSSGCMSSSVIQASLDPSAPAQGGPVSAQPSANTFVLGTESGTIPPTFTTPLQDAKSDGHTLFWSCGDDTNLDAAPDLWTAVPGTTPARIFANPQRDSTLLPIVGASGRYAFVEENSRLYGDTGWRLWYLSGPGASARLIDQDDPRQPQAPLPQLTMSPGHLVWTAFHTDGQGRSVSELLEADLPSLATHVLLSSPFGQTHYWFPSIDGDRLVYSAVDMAKEGTPNHVFLLNLAAASPNPRQLDTTGAAAMPSVNGDTVVWHTGGQLFSWGQLVAYSLDTGTSTPIDLGPQPSALYPSVGNRFVAASGWDETKFFLYDLKERRTVRLEELAPDAPEGDVRPFVAGDLLIWIHGWSLNDKGVAPRPLELHWAWLPG